MTLALAGLALGFGTLFPQFETENAAQIPTSFGGLVFMMSVDRADRRAWSCSRRGRCTRTWARRRSERRASRSEMVIGFGLGGRALRGGDARADRRRAARLERHER